MITCMSIRYKSHNMLFISDPGTGCFQPGGDHPGRFKGHLDFRAVHIFRTIHVFKTIFWTDFRTVVRTDFKAIHVSRRGIFIVHMGKGLHSQNRPCC
jgi:hypothetical protein